MTLMKTSRMADRTAIRKQRKSSEYGLNAVSEETVSSTKKWRISYETYDATPVCTLPGTSWEVKRKMWRCEKVAFRSPPFMPIAPNVRSETVHVWSSSAPMAKDSWAM